MPYYKYCQCCNSNGEYKEVNIDCLQCNGTGSDWSDDVEFVYDFKGADITLKQLKAERVVEGGDGNYYFYEDEFPNIDEARAKVVRFRPKIAHYQKNPSKFKDKLDFFTKNFYLNDGLYLDKKRYSGSFDRVSLNISYFGLNQAVITRVRKGLQELEKVEDKITRLPITEILSTYPQLEELFELQELLAHENFHLIQFLTCNSANKFYKASRRHHVIRAVLFSEAIRCNLQFSPSETSIFDLIEKFDEQSLKEYFIELIKDSKSESLIVNNFFEYKSSITDLTIIDIFEGSAVAFQKLVNRTSFVDVIIQKAKPSMHKRYFGAWDYFQQKGSSDLLIFFIITHQALKYGLLDSEMKNSPTPQDIFVMLCDNISKYEYNLNNNPAFSHFGKIDPILKELDFDNDKIDTLYKLVYTFNTIRDDIKEYYQEKLPKCEIYYEDNFIWDPMRRIHEKIVEDYPIFNTEFFLPLILIDYLSCTRFLAYLPKMLYNITFQGVLGQESDMESDNMMLQLVDDIDDYAKSGFFVARCCDNHQREKVSKIEFCNSEFSLPNRYKLATGKDFDKLINYN